MKSNLIIIMADQLRFDVFNRGYTPNIDALMNESVRFSSAYCASPLCVPSRGAFFTGLCPSSNGSLINPWEKRDAKYGDVKSDIENLYSLMEKEWYSIHSGKQHLFTEGGKLEDRDNLTHWASTEKSYKQMLKDNNVRQPGVLPRFKTYVPEMVDGKVTKVAKYSNAETGLYPFDSKYFFDIYFTDEGIKALKQRDKSKPLFYSAMYLAPHPPLEIPEPWFSLVKKDDVFLPENVGKYYPHQSPLQMYNLTGIVGARYSEEEWREAWRVYLGQVALFDECVGRLINELKTEEIYDNSMIIFTTDHGEMLGSHRLFQKMCMYEESSHVPLTIKFPNGEYARDINTHVSHIDVMPTIMEFLNIESKNDFEGVSLLSLITNGDKKGLNRDIFIQYDGNGARSNFQRCVIRNNYKLILDLFKDEMFVELYDLEKDRIESINLAFDEEYDEEIISMYSSLSKHMKDTSDLITLPTLDLANFRSSYGDIPVRQ